MIRRTEDPEYAELLARLPWISASPSAEGTVRLLCCRPRKGERVVPDELRFDEVVGAVGDDWSTRPGWNTPGGAPDPSAQVTLMNARAIEAIAKDPARWALAGDQVYVDLDLSEANAPAGTRLLVGDAVLEVSPTPHLGCRKFTARFGSHATRFVNSPEGRRLRLRGVNARVVASGIVRVGDTVSRLE
jgi:hypothetical protein